MRTRCASTLVVTCALLGLGLRNSNLTSTSISHLWSLGLGNVNPEALIGFNGSQNLSGPAGVILAVLLANLPQIILSFLYFAYNGLFTCMLLAEEWSGYASKRRFLSHVTNRRAAKHLPFATAVSLRYPTPHRLEYATLVRVTIDLPCPRQCYRFHGS